MSRTRVWHTIAGWREGASPLPAVESLARAGVGSVPLDLDDPRGPGIVFFDAVDEALCDFVRDASRNGLERVLGIGSGAAALAGGAGWRLLRSGASDVFAWDHSRDPAAEVAARFERWEAVDRLVASPLVQHNLVGRSAAWTGLMRQIVEVACFTDAPVLITGESGTGKELVARLVHTLDTRPRKRDLVVLDCTTIVPELSGSEFFGHERGAFTGAVGPREGAFALADGGTLFLDEVGELPPGMQAQLLRVVQEKTFKRVGGNAWNRTEFRLVCATNRNLVDEVARGGFRGDLYYRIASVAFHLPPLRDRPEDVLPLVRHFLEQLRPQEDPPELDDAMCEYLQKREYPGNVRDLRQLVTRIAYRHVGPGPITIGDLPADERPVPLAEELEWRDPSFDTSIRRALSQGIGLKEIGRLATEAAISIAIGDEEGNLQRAAQRLGVTDRALQMRQAARRQSAGEKPN